MTVYVCCNERRRAALRKQHVLNGIDYLDVDDILLPPTHHNHQGQLQSILHIYLINPLAADTLTKKNIFIERDAGGGDVRTVAVVEAEIIHNVLKVTAHNPGDDATYTLKLFPDPVKLKLDPLLSTIDFTFQTSPNLDYTGEQQPCLPESVPEPEIDYMAKDYDSFRQLMLDRLTTLMPQWTERSPADLGVALVELLSYVADSLSYQQDVIATESYLGTARRRTSVRRHARLLDYPMHDGHNARAWVQVQVSQDSVRPDAADASVPAILPKGTPLLTYVSALDNSVVRLPYKSSVYNQAMAAKAEIFEVLYDVNQLYLPHNELFFYTWGARECCLPNGATSATLAGAFPNLRVGDVLIFQEVVGTYSGLAEDAEPTHRCAVRLTSVTVTTDPLGKLFPNPTDTDGSGPKQETVPAQSAQEERETTIVIEQEKLEERKGRKGREELDITETQQVFVEGEIQEPEEGVFDDDEIEQPTIKLPALPPKQLMQLGREGKNEPAKQEPRKSRRGKKGRPAKEEGGEPEDDTIEQVSIEEEEDDITKRITVALDEFERKKGSTEEQHVVEEISVKEEGGYSEERRVLEEERIEKKGRRVEEENTIIQEVTRTKEPDYSVDITEIEWSFEDALPFPVCISSTTDYEHGNRYLPNVSVALGNIILADYGATLEQSLPPVPPSTSTFASNPKMSCGEEQSKVALPPRFTPSLLYGPLTYASSVGGSQTNKAATTLMNPPVEDALPAITLYTLGTDEQTVTSIWKPQRDLLESTSVDRVFVVECENDGTASLRFGDGRHGMRPPPGTVFTARYRVGNGVAGNVGADSLTHIVPDSPTHIISNADRITRINNPLPAQGGLEPESIDSVRLHLPSVFRTQERGVTPDDYKILAERHPEVQRANTYARWTGSWYTVFVVVERIADAPVDEAFLRRIRRYLEQYRMAGGDIELVRPIYVPLEVTMNIRVTPGYFRTTVKEALQEIFSTQHWPNGVRGIFSANEAQAFSFGQSVYLNPLYTAARAVSGVEHVDIIQFERQGIATNEGLQRRELTLSWRELARLDNDPRHPERGIFHINAEVG